MLHKSLQVATTHRKQTAVVDFSHLSGLQTSNNELTPHTPARVLIALSWILLLISALPTKIQVGCATSLCSASNCFGIFS